MRDFDWLRGYDVFGLPLFDLFLALAAALLAWLLLGVGVRFLLRRLEVLARRTATGIDDVMVDVLSGTSRWLILVAALMIGASTLELGPRWSERINHLWFVALALQLGLWLTRAIGAGIQRYEKRHRPGGNGHLSATTALFSWFLRTVLWTVILLAVLANLGVNITAFVASLGVGGVAVALAVQNILGDLFASLAIAVDKPFEVGDFIGSGVGTGTVEYVGLKTTHIRSLEGEQLVVSNTELLKQPLRNYKRMTRRRIVLRFGIAYDTPPDRVESVPALVRRLVEQDDKASFDRVHFANLGDSALEFELVYHVLDADYGVYMDVHQRINLGLLREFGARGIQFAFPSRTLYIAPLAPETRELLPQPARMSMQ